MSRLLRGADCGCVNTPGVPPIARSIPIFESIGSEKERERVERRGLGQHVNSAVTAWQCDEEYTDSVALEQQYINEFAKQI